MSQGLVVIPTDSATPVQVRTYRAYAAARYERTLTPPGPRRMLFAPDIVGTSPEIAGQLFGHAGFLRTQEATFALPFFFDDADYVQILTDMAVHLGPLLGVDTGLRLTTPPPSHAPTR